MTDPSRTPVWLLDVDGVLNAGRPGWSAAPMSRWATALGKQWRIRFEPSLVRRIGELHRAGAVEVRWATTWCPDAAELERIFAWPALARALTENEARGGPAASHPAKLRAALSVVEVERRPLIWADDEAVPAAGTDRDRLMSGAAPTLLLEPSSRRGLRPDDLAAVEAFLSSVA